jgi:hypothetical protein
MLVVKLVVQGRYKLDLFLRLLSRSLQGVAVRPLPCNYNVIQPISALSRRKRGFKSRRGRQFNSLGEKRLLSVYNEERKSLGSVYVTHIMSRPSRYARHTALPSIATRALEMLSDHVVSSCSSPSLWRFRGGNVPRNRPGRP